ncbi:aldo/keto reductase [Nisaea acidiphila]|uniref:Aldo/keto reductase n=1 Tax=Nisaea acidiphila TaxID=1862145 RepID=A0A9J7ASX2_9PROT|nr:aldo/keto reductase [Nisaea acidiphila]UUX50383.1 aldo/keto reductase [Nisaea acidiphila]
MRFLDTDIPQLGLGTWPLGGPFYAGEQSLGYANADPGEAIKAIDAAWDGGIRLFDTANAYGAGHAEYLLGRALENRPDAIIATKVGMSFDERTKQIGGDVTDPAQIVASIEDCLRRLRRDRIDMLFLHHNDLPVERAEPIFEIFAKARAAGKVRAFGWSTDFPARVEAMAGRDGFAAVQHVMNVFFDAPSMQATLEKNGLVGFIRSPLAMGVLTGKYLADSSVPADDIRSMNSETRDYFRDGKPGAGYLADLDAVRELLTSGGRTLAQGSLCWLMTKSSGNLPIPGGRTAAQVEENIGALDHGRFSQDVMEEIEAVLKREPEGEPRSR